jgi:hypothetical protein
MGDHPAADQPDPIAPPDNPDQPLRGPQWARVALANQHDPETRRRQIAELPQSEFMSSGFIPHDEREPVARRPIPDAILVDDDQDDEQEQDEKEEQP